MIFLTVGTAFPFDRLVQAIDMLVGQGKIAANIYAQVGIGGYQAKNFETIETLDKTEFDRHFTKAEALIAHAGMGTITMALTEHKPILVMPRLRKYRELVNDHQLATAKRFEKLGHVLAAYNTNELAAQIRKLTAFQPTPRISQAELVAKRVGDFLRE